MPLHVEFLPEPDARWHGLPVLDVRAEALFEARLWVGVLRDGKPLFSVTLHEPPMVEAWRGRAAWRTASCSPAIGTCT